MKKAQWLDAGAFGDLSGKWRPVIAVDGKTSRGSGHGGGNIRYLLAGLPWRDTPVARQARDWATAAPPSGAA